MNIGKRQCRSLPSSEHASYRRKMVKLVTLTIHKMDKRIKNSAGVNDKASMKRIITQARYIEFLMYNNAPTFEEYMDRSTFLQRFVSVVKDQMIKKNSSNSRIVGKI